MNGNKRKLMVFHQYLAPYRIDFFNALARIGEMEAFFEYENSPDHHYNRREMEARCAFRPQYLNHVRVAGRRVPSGLARILRQGRPDLVIVPEFPHSGSGGMPAARGLPLEIQNRQHLR